MTISFSGPASGIDTSAWVDALVKMKQANVTSMENKKEILVATTSILDNVKSFFSSFKSVISTVTQSNLGIASFDLFVQNLVETSNANVVTASVTTEAQQDNYEVFVDQVATETQASSVFFTNIISTTENIATHNSLLSSIGIGTGNVGFTVGGVERIITLQSNDTIGSLIEKLNKIGVDASYDSQMGYFSINLSVEDINDDLDGDGIDNTGIKQAFFLEDVNSGYSSDELELSYMDTFIIKATEEAKMSLFGVTKGEFAVTNEAGDTILLSADIDGSFRDFFNVLEGYGLFASFDADGVISIETRSGYLLSGSLAEQLGIVIDDQSHKTDTKASSTIGVFSTEIRNAEYTSTMDEIGGIVNTSDTLKVYDVHNNQIAEINTLTKDSTVDDLFEALGMYGIEGKLNNNVISFESVNGNIIGGAIAENLGVNTEQTSVTTIKTGETTTSTAMISYVASATDWISDCLWDVWDSYKEADKVLTVTHTDRYGTDQTYTYRVVEKNEIAADGSVQKGTQFQDIANWYKSIDPTATFTFNDNGQIFIDSNDCFYFEGKIAEYLGIGGHTETYTWTQGSSTTSSNSTISYRVRSTDHLSDVLWDNGWATYSANDKVIKAYSITVDHTSGKNSVNHPDGAEGNYVENAGTYQHTIQTLYKTFTIIESKTTMNADGTVRTITVGSTLEDLAKWYTTEVDKTATFIINNNGTITIDSNENFHIEGKAVTDLGLGISTYAQSWTTGLEETVSTGSVTYAAKMTDYISDTFTSAQWNKVNKVISVYSSNVDHVNGGDGNSVYHVTIQTKLTDITITTDTTFNDLRDALAPYDITLSMNSGVLTLDSSKSNYLVEDVFQNISIQNGVTVLQARTTSSNGTTSMIQHFGITYDTITNYWTTGNAATESTGVVNYVIKSTDYISDTFTATQWANLSNYKNSAGNTYAGNVISVMHAELNHSTHQTVITTATTITINTNTTFADLANKLSPWGITLGISDGVLTFDSTQASAHNNNLYYIEGRIPDHYGVRYDSITQNWTTGAEQTKSTSEISYLADNDDLIRNMFTTSEWSGLNKTITVYNMSYNYSTHATVKNTVDSFTIGDNWRISDLNNKLATYGISCSVANGKVSLDSANGNWVEGALANHMGLGNNTITLTSTIGTTVTSANTIYNTVNASDTIYDHLYGSWNNLNKNYTIMQSTIDYSTGNKVEVAIKTLSISSTTTFNDLKNTLANYNLTMNITNGAVSLSGKYNYYIKGDIPTAIGMGTTTKDVTYTYAVSATSTGILTYAGLNNADKISDIVGWENISNKNVYVVNRYYNRNSHSMVYATVKTIGTTGTTVSALNAATSSYGISIGANGNAITCSESNSAYYIDGAMVNFLGIGANTTSKTATVGKSYTGSALTAYAKADSLMSDFGASYDVYLYKYNAMSGSGSYQNQRVVSTGKTFQQFVNDVNAMTGTSASFSNSTISFSCSGGYYNNYTGYSTSARTIWTSSSCSGGKYSYDTSHYVSVWVTSTQTVTYTVTTTTTTTSTSTSTYSIYKYTSNDDDLERFDMANNNSVWNTNSKDASYGYKYLRAGGCRTGKMTFTAENCNNGIGTGVTKTISVTLTTDKSKDAKTLNALFKSNGLNLDASTDEDDNLCIVPTNRDKMNCVITHVEVAANSTRWVYVLYGSKSVNSTGTTTTTTTSTQTISTTTTKIKDTSHYENSWKVESTALNDWAWSNKAISAYGMQGGVIRLFKYKDNGAGVITTETKNVTYTATETLATIASRLSGYGITMERSSSGVKMSSSGGGSGAWLLDSGSTGSLAYSLSVGSGTKYNWNGASYSSGAWSKTADGATKLKELGFDSTGNLFKVKSFTSNIEGQGSSSDSNTASFNGNTTLNTVISTLNNNGLAASLSGGKITIASSGKNYISGVANTTMASKLGLSTSASSYQTTASWTQYTNKSTGSNQTQYITDNNVTRATLERMGYSSNQNFVSSKHTAAYDPTQVANTTITWEKTTSLSGFMEQLRNAGYTVTFNGSAHTVSVASKSIYSYNLSSTGAKNPLKLGATYGSKTITYINAGSSGTTLYHTLHGATTLGDLNITSNQVITFVGHVNNTYAQDCTTANGHKITGTNNTYTVTWTTAQTLDQFIAAFNNSTPAKSFGCTISYDASKGKITVKGSNTAYVSGMTDGLKNTIKLNSAYYQSSTYNLIDEAKSTKTGLLTYLNGETRLGDMTINSAQTIDIVLHNNHTFGTDMTKASNVSHTITVTWQTGEQLDTFINRINTSINAQKTAYGFDYALNVRVNEADRTLEFTGNEYTYVSNVSTALKNYVKINTKENGTYGKSYGYTMNYRANADTAKDYTYVNERNTKLHNLSINSEQTMTFVVHNNNTFAQNQTDGLNVATNVTRTITVTWTTSETLGSFERKVNQRLNSLYSQVGAPANTGQYGITFSVNAENGKWKIIGNEYTYLYDVSDPLENYMKLTGDKKENGTYGTSYSYNVIYRADADKNTGGTNPTAIDYTYLNGRNTTLNNLSYVNSKGKTVSTTQSQTMDIVIHINNTYAQDNTKSAIQQQARSSSSTYTVTSTVALTQTSSNAITYNTVVTATTAHTLAELGFTASEGTTAVYDKYGNKLGEFTLRNTNSLNDFLTEINNLNSNAKAKISSSGVISLSDGYLTGAIAEHLGLNMEDQGFKTTAISLTSASEITYYSTVNISSSTSFADLGISTAGVQEVFDKFGNKVGEFTLESSATIGDYLNGINSLSSSNNAKLTNGAISIADGYVTGNIAEQIGLGRGDGTGSYKVAKTITGTDAVNYFTNVNADKNTKLGELLETNNYSVTLYDKYGENATNILLTANTTIEELVAAINNANPNANATFTNGKLKIASGYITGELATRLNMTNTIGHETTTVAASLMSSEAVSNTLISNATGSSSLRDLGINTVQTVTVHNIYGTQAETITVSDTATLNDLTNAINSVTFTDGATVGAKFENGVLSLASGYIEGDINNVLNMSDHTTIAVRTEAMVVTSSEGLFYKTSENATAQTALSTFGINSAEEVVVHDRYGNISGTINVSSTTTIGELRDAINNFQFTNGSSPVATLGANGDTENLLRITNGYISGNVATALNLTNYNYDSEVNITNITITSTATMTCTNGTTATANSTMYELGITGDFTFTLTNGQKVTIKSSNTSTGNSDTIAQMITKLNEKGLNCKFEDGKMYFGSDGEVNINSVTGYTKYFKVASKLQTYTSQTIKLQGTTGTLAYETLHGIDEKEGVTFGDIGMNNTTNFKYYDVSEGTIKQVDTTKSTVIEDAFEEAGFSLSVDPQGRVSIISTNGNYLTEGTANYFKNGFKINVGEGKSYGDVNYTLHDSATQTLQTVRTVTLDENTTLGDFGIIQAATIMYYDGSSTKSIGIYSGDSIMSRLRELESKGFSVDLVDGKVSIESNDGKHYIKSFTDNLSGLLRITTGEGNSYNNVPHDTYSTGSSTVTYNLPQTINENTKLSDLGLSRATITIAETTTQLLYGNDNILQRLRDFGFDVNVNNVGVVSISSSDPGHYISFMSKGLQEALNISIGENNSWDWYTFEKFSSTTSNQLLTESSLIFNSNSKLTDFGVNQNATIVYSKTGTTLVTMTISTSESIMNKLSTLKNNGFNVTLSNGKISISSSNGTSYIKEMSADLANILNISTGDGESYEISHLFSSTNTAARKATLNSTINENTTLANLGVTSNATITTNNGTIVIGKNDKLLAKLRNAGLGVSIVNGRLSITGDDTTYIKKLSNNIKNALKVEVGEGKTYRTIVDEVVTDGDISGVTRTITVTWTYGTLGTEDTDAKPETMNQFIADINRSLAQATTQYKAMFNLSEDFTLSSYVDGDGKFHFTGDEYTYVSRVDDFLANALKIKSATKEGHSYGKSYSYNIQYANNSNNKTQYTYTNYDNMRLQNFDTYTDQYITIVTHNNTTFAADATDDRVVKNGTILRDETTTTYVITWTAGSTGHTLTGTNSYNNNSNAITDGETFQEFVYQLEHFGTLNQLATEASAVLGNDIYKINVTINADKTISLVGNEYTYILGISDGLQKDFRIQNSKGEGFYYNKYDYDIRFNNDGYTKQNTTLLNYDTRLDNLGITADMTMTLETPEGGKSIIFDHDTTMQEIRNRLFNDYGIEVTIEDKTGRISFTPTLIDEGYYIVGMDTELKNGLKLITGEKGTYTLDSEQIIATNKAGVYTTTTYHGVTTTGGTYETTTENNYDNTASRNLRFEDTDNVIKASTRISRLNGYDNGNGNITVHYADGLEQNISIRESMTLGQLNDILKDYGVTSEILAGGRVTFQSNDGTYLKSAEGGSNLLSILNMSDFSIKTEGDTIITSKTLQYKEEKEFRYFASEETTLSSFADGLLEANGVITFSQNGTYKSVTLTSDDTFATLIQKFKDKGLNAKIESGKLSVSSGFDTFSIIEEATTSNLSAIINLTEKIDLGGYAMTNRSKTIMSTTTITDTKSLSVVNFADENTTLDTFGIFGGSLSIYADGKKAGIQVSGTDTIRTLQNKFRTALGQDVNGSDEENLTLRFEDGYLKVSQKDTNLIVGSNEDTSNFGAITGIFTNNGVAESTRQFFKANENTKVTEAGIFRNGVVTTGDFVIGDATITIDETTTLGELASQINTNPDTNVNAYWDSIDGELRIVSNNTGNFFINFESGSSNLTDILGFTKTSHDEATGTATTTINTDVQKQGKNARVRINGAAYTSVSNTLGSDVTSIKGLTINVKGMSAGEATILSVKRDVQSLALAVSDVIDAYNALIDNINGALSSKSELKNDSELKRLRNQIKSIMTGTNKNSSIFKNILSIGIVTNTADPTNLSVGSGIYKLSLDNEKFAKAFEADSDSVRTLLIGRVDDEGNLIEEGILTKLEALIDEAVENAGGYFERTEESFERQINRLDNKIAKGNDAIEKYRERLEKKYMSMNILNSNIQTQYQVYFN